MGGYETNTSQERCGSRNWRPWHWARKSRKVEQHEDYIWLLISEGAQNWQLGESKENIAKTSTGQQTCLRYEQRTLCDCLWLTGNYANTCLLQQCQLTAEQQLQHHTTASFNIFRCATECKSRHLNYKK